MPLRLVRRAGSDRFYLRGTVRGRRVFESTGVGERGQAEEIRAMREAELVRESIHGKSAVVTFAHAAESYLSAESRSPNTCALVGRLLRHFATMPLHRIDQHELDRAYKALLRPGAAPATRLRNVLAPLRAILEHAAVRRWCERPAFDTPRQPPGRVQFLRPAEAEALIAAAAPHLKPLLVFLLTTGARMSEAPELDWRNVDLHGQRAELIRTKTGRARHVELVPRMLAALAEMEHYDGRVFRPVYSVRDDSGRKREGAGYRDTDRTGGGQIRTAWAGACRRAGLPGAWEARDGRRRRRWLPELHPHDLRHAWATWHYAAHRDLLRLQAAGGWTSVNLVTRYAHLLPEVYTAEARAWLEVKGRAPGARTGGTRR